MADVRGIERGFLRALIIFTVLSVGGFATFGQNPGLLARFPDLAGFYAPAFTVFARGHIVLAFVVLAVILHGRVGWEWLRLFALVALLSLGAELLGTATGVPFGEYRYTELLGYRIGGLVPFLIPVSWFVMALPAYAIARRLADDRWARLAFGAALLTTWDLTLDPAMSALTPYWVWDTPGSFYGMPAVNLLGWFGTGLVLMTGLELVGAGRIADRLPPRLVSQYYGTVLSLSIGMVAVAGYWLAVVATAAALTAIVLASRVVAGRSSGRLQGLVEGEGAT